LDLIALIIVDVTALNLEALQTTEEEEAQETLELLDTLETLHTLELLAHWDHQGSSRKTQNRS